MNTASSAAGPRRPQDLPEIGRGRIARARGRQSRAGARRDRRPARPLGIGQVHAVAVDRRAGPAERRRDQLSRQACTRSGRGRGHGLPELRAVSVADGLRERRARARGAAAAEGQDPRAFAGRDRPHRAGRIRIRLSAGTLRRHAPARGFRARAGRASEHPADGRAVLGTRRVDRRDAAHGLPRPVVGRTDADQGRACSSRTTSRRRC